MLIKTFEYDRTKITALALDTWGSSYIWLGFTKDGEICELLKCLSSDPNQIYYNLELSVDKIVDLKVDNTYLYCAVEHATYCGYRYNKNSPLTTSTALTRPVSVNENPIQIAIDSSYIYFLFPGSMSGEIAKIVKMTLSGTVSNIIELSKSGEEIHNAVSITISGTNLWVVTEDNPTKLIRVYENLGSYTFDSHEIITTV